MIERTTFASVMVSALMAFVTGGCGEDSSMNMDDVPSVGDGGTALSLDEEGCEAPSMVTLGPDGGEASHHHATISADEGALTEEVTLEISRCPGAVSDPEQHRELTYRYTHSYPANGGADAGAEGTAYDHYVMTHSLHPSETYPPIRIKAAGDDPSHLPLAEGQMLKYCLNTEAEHGADQFIIYHDDDVGLPHPEHFYHDDNTEWTPSAEQQCIRFTHLSWWSHFKHEVEHTAKHIANKVKNAAEKAASEASNEYKKVSHDVEDLAKKLADPCYDCKEAGKKAFSKVSCGGFASVVSGDAECAGEIAEVQPEMAEYAPAICTALSMTAKYMCKKYALDESGLQQKADETIERMCKGVHLCN